MYHLPMFRVMSGEGATFYREAMNRLHTAFEQRIITPDDYTARMRSIAGWVRERGYVVLPEGHVHRAPRHERLSCLTVGAG